MTASEFTPIAGSGYLFSTGGEERAEHVEVWRGSTDVVLAEVVDEDEASITVKIGDKTYDTFLRSHEGVQELLRHLPDALYLDITGLPHHVWAPILRAALDTGKSLWGIYVEPGEYTRTLTPTEGTIYDLSERIAGISPLPTFATLAEPSEEDSLFVPLLGFEGTRLIHVTEHVQPPGDSTVPIVGVPGFRAEYPFVALKGNRKPLLDGGYWVNLRYATANCPFDLFFALRGVVVEFQKSYLRVAPIGTKPHGLGAVLFALSSEDHVELIYDHPIRKAGRTTGSARLCLYDIATFVSADDYRWASAEAS
jgi:hypothetical protein